MKYMEQLQQRVTNGGAGPYSQPENCKIIKWIRLVARDLDGTGTYKYLTKLDSGSDLAVITGEEVSCYWEDGRDWIWFNSILSQTTETTFEVYYDRFSGPFQDDSTCWLFDYGMEVIVARAMMNFAGWLRQPTIFPLYREQFTTGIKSLLKSDVDARLAGTDVTYGQLAA